MQPSLFDPSQTCSICGEAKPLFEFSLSRGKLRSQCKKCRSAQQMARYYQDAEASRERSRRRYQDNESVRQRESEMRKRYYQANREKVGQTSRKWYEANRERAQTSGRAWHLRNKFGISLEAYDALADIQHDCCALCGKENTGRSWHVDHDHACCPGEKCCGKCIRGLLCARCNLDLGLIERWAADGRLVVTGKLDEYINRPPWGQLLTAVEIGSLMLGFSR